MDLSHGGAETLMLAAAIALYGFVQWKAVAKTTGAWRFTALLPVWFVASCIAFFIALGPKTALDWWWVTVVVGLVCVLALLYLGLHRLLFKLAHMDDRM